MAFIYFYDSTKLDKQQLGSVLQSNEHRYEHVPEKISPDNVDPETEAISVFVTSTVTREIIEALPRLKLIACRSTGFNNIDMDAAKEHGVTVVNVPTYGEQTVAEYTFALLLALVRKLPEVFEAENRTFSQTNLIGHDLGGKTFGVVGTGHIGKKTIAIGRGFGMNVIAHDVFPRQELEAELGFKFVPLDELLAKSDVISLHLPYLPSTHHIVNAERLAQIRRGSVLINTARGELIDTAALVESLSSGHLGGAALDVVEGEALLKYEEETALLRSHKLPPELLKHSMEISALKKMPNVIISPHNAFNTYEAIWRINRTTAKNILDFWHGDTPNKVEPAKKPFGKLLIARHGESEWNATGKWTGITDVHLSDKGFREAAMLGDALKKLEIKVDIAFCSEQIRSRETLEGMLNASQQFDVDIVVDRGINERDYGQYTGKNKWEMKKIIGEEAFNRIRRGWDEPIPGGETLKDVYERAVPFYLQTVLPLLRAGKNVLIVAHGNSIRALVKHLESISDEDVSKLEMMFGQIVVYDVTPEGLSSGSRVVRIDTTLPPA